MKFQEIQNMIKHINKMENNDPNQKIMHLVNLFPEVDNRIT